MVTREKKHIDGVSYIHSSNGQRIGVVAEEKI